MTAIGLVGSAGRSSNLTVHLADTSTSISATTQPFGQSGLTTG
jgi:hypothetical protein